LTEPLQVGQFAIVDHEPVERGPNAGIFIGRGPAEDRPELYLLAEGTTPAGDAFAGHVVSAAGQRWASFDMSVTGALKRVFDDANASLVDWNRKSIAQHRVRIGLAGLARRGGQAVLAQAGPSVVFHVTARGAFAYYTDDEHAAPLGMGPVASPQFRRLDLQPGDRLLMVSTVAVNELDDDVVAGILALPVDQVLPNLFRRVRGLRDVTALFLSRPASARALPDAEPDHVIGAGAATADDPQGYQPSLFISERAEDEVDLARRQLFAVSERVRLTSTVAPSMTGAVAVPEPLRRVAGGESYATVASRAQASLVAAGSFTRQLAPAVPASPALRDESFTRKLSGRRPPPPPPPVAADARPVSELADDRRAQQRSLVPAADSLVVEDGPTIEAVPLVRPRSSPATRFRAAAGGREWPAFRGHIPTWMIAAGGLLALLIVVGYIAGPQLLNRDADERFLSLIDGAERNLANARAVTDGVAQREALNTAHAMLLEARDMAPESTEVSRLLLEVEEALNTLDAVRTPVLVEDLANLEQFGPAPVTADSLVVAGEVIYLLDGAAGQVIAVPLDGSLPNVVYTAGDATGRARPVAFDWYEAPDLGGPTLLVADAEDRLWGIAAGQVQPLTFAIPGGVTDIAVWDSHLYVLDAAARTVYRMLPGEGGFVNPDPILQSSELSAAVRLTVQGDEVYTSDANGTVHRFAGTISLALAAAGIDKPLTTGRKPWAIGESGEIAVLDPPNNRIVVVGQDGTFSHQYRHPDFATSLAFALEGGRGYLFSGGHLRVITFEE
jgi:hypothetical protein